MMVVMRMLGGDVVSMGMWGAVEDEGGLGKWGKGLWLFHLWCALLSVLTKPPRW